MPTRVFTQQKKSGKLIDLIDKDDMDKIMEDENGPHYKFLKREMGFIYLELGRHKDNPDKKNQTFRNSDTVANISKFSFANCQVKYNQWNRWQENHLMFCNGTISLKVPNIILLINLLILVIQSVLLLLSSNENDHVSGPIAYLSAVNLIKFYIYVGLIEIFRTYKFKIYLISFGFCMSIIQASVSANVDTEDIQQNFLLISCLNWLVICILAVLFS